MMRMSTSAMIPPPSPTCPAHTTLFSALIFAPRNLVQRTLSINGSRVEWMRVAPRTAQAVRASGG
eukprot:1731746-Rhodomonas_salina.1